MRKRRSFACLYLLFFAFVFPATAAGTEVPLNVHESGLALSNPLVLSLAQDPVGYMWFGTGDGLNRYDGHSLIAYKPNPRKPFSVGGNVVHGLAPDGNGAIWIAHNRGISIYLNREDRFLSQFPFEFAFDGHHLPEFQHIVCAGKQAVAWSNGMNGYAFFERNGSVVHGKKAELNLPSDEGLTGIRSDASRGMFWASTNKGTLLHFNPGKTPVTLKKFGEGIRALGTLNNGVWCLVGKTLFSYKNNGDLEILNERVEWAWDCGNGSVLFLEAGRYQLRQPDRSLYTFSLEDGLLLNGAFLDRSGVLWLGSAHGLLTLDLHQKGFRVLPGLNPSSCWAVVANFKGHTWIGCDEGLWKGKPSGAAFSWLRPNQTKPSVFAVTEDPMHQTLVVGGQGWISSFDGRKFRPLQLPKGLLDSLSGLRINHIRQHADGTWWVGTQAGLLVVSSDWQNGRWYAYNALASGGNPIRQILFDDVGRAWGASDGGGLYCWEVSRGWPARERHWIAQPQEPTSLSSNNLLSLSWHSGYLWVGTLGGGLNQWDAQRSRVVNTWLEDNGLPDNTVYSLVATARNGIWMSTNRGLCHLEPKTGSLQAYTKDDGLGFSEFNTGACAAGEDGLLFFGGEDGAVYFRAGSIRNNPVPAFPGISQMEVLGRAFPFTHHERGVDTVKLSFKARFISLQLSAFHYAASEKNRFRYRLEGVDEDWMPLRKGNVVQYANLEPGAYDFFLQASNNDGKWSEPKMVLHLVITPPLYKNRWLRMVVFCGLGLLFFILFQRRKRSISRQHRLLTSLVEERTAKITEQAERIRSQHRDLENEKNRADALLHNILPAEMVEELKNKGRASARSYRTATVMFTDFVGFTKEAERMRPQALVSELDACFRGFDAIIEKYNIEKIKTIGDSYMCAGGVPIRNISNPFETVLAGLEMHRFLASREETNERLGLPLWKLRIGIHTGELVAGVIGSKRLAYDIWGDTVNVAKRLETSGSPGMVNISGVTYELIKDFFLCTHRGKVEAKNKGLVDMYFVEKVLPELSVEGMGIEPNALFWQKLNQHLYSRFNYKKSEQHILRQLEEGLPEYYYYHSLGHTLDVRDASERIARAENLSEEDVVLLKTAALYHDAGFVLQYDNNEVLGAEMAARDLPAFGYSDHQINTIKKLIMSTQVPQTASNAMESVICDADLDYLGRDDFEEISKRLFQELKKLNKVTSAREWDEIQDRFLTAHTYYTATSITQRSAKKAEHLEKIRMRLQRNDYPANED